MKMSLSHLKSRTNMPWLAVVLSIVSVSACPAAEAQGVGTARGTLTVNGKSTPLRHAYAVAEPDDPKQIRVILSDAPLTRATLEDVFARGDLAAAGKLHAVEVVMDAGKQPVSGAFRHSAWRTSSGTLSATGMHVFEPATFTGNRVSGKLFMRKRGEFNGTTFQYSATFSAPVLRKAPPTFTGSRARQSEPAKVALSYFAACRAGDVAAIRRHLPSERAKLLDGPQSKQILEFLKLASPNPATARITRVDIQGNRASVEFQEKDASGALEKTTIKLARTAGGGPWLINE